MQGLHRLCLGVPQRVPADQPNVQFGTRYGTVEQQTFASFSEVSIVFGVHGSALL